MKSATLQIFVFVLVLAGVATAFGAPVSGNEPQLNEKQQQHLQLYIRTEQMVAARKLTPSKAFLVFYKPVSQECHGQIDTYKTMSLEKIQAADAAKVNGEDAQARLLNQQAKVYSDFSDACKAIEEAIKKRDPKTLNESIKRYLGIEKFVNSKQMETLGRGWLTQTECGRLCPPENLRKMPNPYLEKPKNTSPSRPAAPAK